MNEVPDTELFSAYLDGELTADEQLRVEQILAASAEARQLLEELRALGNTLQNLPQEKLDEDLSARVLQLAERRMLLPGDGDNKPSAGRAADTLRPPQDDAIGWLGIPWREISWRGMFSKRALVWSGVVVATAIVIFFTSPPPPNRELAMREKAPAAATRAEPRDERDTRSTSEGAWDAPAGERKTGRADNRLVAGKDMSRKAAKAEDQEASGDARSDPGKETEQLKEEVASFRLGAAGNEFAEKRALKSELSAGRMSKAGAQELARDRALAEGVAEEAGATHRRDAKKPSAEMSMGSGGSLTATGAGKSAAGLTVEKPASGPVAAKSGNQDEKLAMRERLGQRAKWADNDVAGNKTLGEAAKDAVASKKPGPDYGVPVEKKKPAPVGDLAADTRPAPPAAPMPAAPPLAAPSEPKRPEADAARPAAETPPPAVAMSQSPPAPKARGGAAPAVAKSAAGKAASDDVDGVKQNTKSDESGRLVDAGGLVTANGSVMLADQVAPATTFVLDVSSLAVENKVFENLLAGNGLGSDHGLATSARGAPAGNGASFGGQAAQGGAGGSGMPELNRQQNSMDKYGAMKGGATPAAPAGSASSGSLRGQQVASQPAPAAAQEDYSSHPQKSEGSSRAPATPTNSPHEIAKALAPQHDGKDAPQLLAKTVIYRFDASPEQLVNIMRQIGERAESFSAPEVRLGGWALSANGSLADLRNYNYFGDNLSNGPVGDGTGRGIQQQPGLQGNNTYNGTLNGGALNNRQSGQEQAKAKADFSPAKIAPEATAKPQVAAAPVAVQAKPAAAPAAGAAKRHVVFVLNVVDRLPPAAARASELPASASPPAAKH